MGSRRGRGEGSIQRLPDGRWKGTTSTTRDGERSRRVFYGRTKEELLSKMKSATNLAPSPTLGDWVDRWVERKKRSTRVSTWKSVVYHLSRFEGIRSVPLRELRPAEIDSAIPEVSNSERRKSLVDLRSCLDLAVRQGLLSRNPVRDVPLPRRPDPVVEYWTADEVRRAIEIDDSGIVRFAVDSGCRQGEIFALTSDDVEGDIVKVSKSYCQRTRTLVPTKTGKTRYIRLTPETVRGLRSGVLFPSSSNTYQHASNFTRRVWVPLASKVRPIRFHDLRHTCATLLLAAGVPLPAISARLGHSDVATTLRVYAHVLPNVEDLVVSSLRQALNRHPEST